MPFRLRNTLTALVAGAAALSLSACDVEQTEEGEMPEVDVKGGNMPEYDVDTPDVDVRTEERTVEVPVVDVEPADAGDQAPAEGQ